MSVYYYKLWHLLERRKIDERTFFESLHISAGTIIKLKKDLPVSMDIIDRIRGSLNCDYGDIITAHQEENRVPRDWLTENVACCSDICRVELQKYLCDYSLTISDLMKLTSLSRNTLKDFLNGGTITSRTFLRLLRLEGFSERINEAAKIAGFGSDGFEHLAPLKHQGENRTC